MNKAVSTLMHWLGISHNRTSHREKMVSGAGGFLGIILILVCTRQFVEPGAAGLIVASMGASAVLVFAVPHGPLSQPWAVAGGHLVSAAIGVSCYILIPDLFFAAAAAVGLAITAMYYLRCIHPPGGATALSAVVAGPGVHELGYGYLVTPVLINVVIILAIAVLFNYLFAWRRYPAAMMHYGRKASEQVETPEENLSRKDLEHALEQLNMYVDVSHEDLEQIYQLARNRTDRKLTTDRIKLGHYYSNGEYGSKWSVRQVVDETDNPQPGNDQIIYKVVAGNGRRSSGTSDRAEFSNWAKYEVRMNESSWQRVIPSSDTNDGT